MELNPYMVQVEEVVVTIHHSQEVVPVELMQVMVQVIIPMEQVLLMGMVAEVVVKEQVIFLIQPEMEEMEL
jgi:hypothetical protein